MFKYVAVFCSILQYFAVFCSILQYFAVFFGIFHYVSYAYIVCIFLCLRETFGNLRAIFGNLG